MGEKGWSFASVDKFPAADVDPLYGSHYVRDLYLKADPNYDGRFVRFAAFWSSETVFVTIPPIRVTVPVLWDKKNQTIVNNESSEIIRIFNTEFNDLLPTDKAKIDVYPEELREEIDTVNEWVLSTVNSQYSQCSSLVPEVFTGLPCPGGVYKAGFAGTTDAYEAAVYPLFEGLDKVEKMLEGKEFFVGNQLTEADIRLWVTAVRFPLPIFLGVRLTFGPN